LEGERRRNIGRNEICLVPCKCAIMKKRLAKSSICKYVNWVNTQFSLDGILSDNLAKRDDGNRKTSTIYANAIIHMAIPSTLQ
jgi:hypothetical protein